MPLEALKQEVERLIEAGNEKALEAFVLAHFTELPEEVQKRLLFSFFTETAERQVGEARVGDIQKQGVELLEQLEKIKSEIHQK